MISDRYRCVFVHIPKTAGTSIERAMGWIPDDAISKDGSLRRNAQDHRTLIELRRAMPEADFAAYFKFTFVRNPWVRVASWYMNIIHDEFHRANFGVAAECTFRDFLVEHGGTWGLQPLRYWVGNDNGEIELDFIGRFEKVRADFDAVCRQLGITALELPHLRRAQERTHYTNLYDKECREIVANRYAEEIEMLGYRYGD
jgi:hypothetical protein